MQIATTPLGLADIGRWAGWLAALCAAAGGVAYACSGRRWLRAYRAEPAAHGRGESVAVLVIFAVAGPVLLVGR